MAKLLNERLADSLDLYHQAKEAHWNVKGPSFIDLHELFDSVASHAVEWSDDIAERAVQLGALAEGTTQAVAKRTSLPEYDSTLTDGMGHVDKLSTAIAAFGAHVRKAIETADKAGDRDTADLFTVISRGADKDLWFVEAHLQKGR